MKNLFIAILVILTGGAFFAYKEGYLADYHPMLDPGVTSDPQSENRENASYGKSEEEPIAETDEKPSLDQKKLIAAEKRAKEKAEEEARERSESEKERLETEKRNAERAEKIAAAQAEKQAKFELTKRINEEVSKMLTQTDEIRRQIQSTEQKMRSKELEWRREKIQRSESEKNEFRASTASYIEGLKSKIADLEAQIRAKRNEIP